MDTFFTVLFNLYMNMPPCLHTCMQLDHFQYNKSNGEFELLWCIAWFESNCPDNINQLISYKHVISTPSSFVCSYLCSSTCWLYQKLLIVELKAWNCVRTCWIWGNCLHMFSEPSRTGQVLGRVEKQEL